MKILIVEDEIALADSIGDNLRSKGYDVVCAYDGSKGFDYITDKKFDLILLDLMLPRISGLEILERMRKAKNNTPVIILTALDSVEDKVAGLDCGANDYMTKPFSTEELLARIRVYERKNSNTSPKSDIIRYKNTRLDISTFEVYTEKESIRLSAMELKILKYFMERPKKVIPKSELYAAIWGYEEALESNSAEVYITFIRKKLFFVHSDIEIIAVRGAGYRLE